MHRGGNCALLFHKGALLKDPKGVLIQQTKNVRSATVKAYVRDGTDIERAGGLDTDASETADAG